MNNAALRSRLWATFCVIVYAVLVVLALVVAFLTPVPQARAQSPAQAVATIAPVIPVKIPETSALYRLKLERAAGERFGLDAPVARIAAQIHAESTWRPKVASKYAQGLAQFTPSTANWLPTVCPDVGPPDAWDPNWSIRAVVCYDHYLHVSAPGRTACDRWAFTLSDYNGGPTMRQREQRIAALSGADPQRWFGQVDRIRVRGVDAHKENRDYVRKVLRELEPAYLAAGWPGKADCT